MIGDDALFLLGDDGALLLGACDDRFKGRQQVVLVHGLAIKSEPEEASSYPHGSLCCASKMKRSLASPLGKFLRFPGKVPIGVLDSENTAGPLHLTLQNTPFTTL